MVAKIVGRDISNLDESGVVRSTVESAAENLSDGFIAPLFWYILLGLPGLFAYKVINTADSMIAHKSDRYEEFGWATAKLDDIVKTSYQSLQDVLKIFNSINIKELSDKGETIKFIKE